MAMASQTYGRALVGPRFDLGGSSAHQSDCGGTAYPQLSGTWKLMSR